MSVVGLVVICVALGYVLGHFFALPVLIAVSAICIVTQIYLWMTCEELETIFAMIFSIYGTLATVVMWTTYYIETDQKWFGEFLHQNILR